MDDDDAVDDDDAGPPDEDEDGYAADVDCNDDDPAIHPDADEIYCDEIDQDCVGGDICRTDICQVAGEEIGDQPPGRYMQWTFSLAATAPLHGGKDCLDDSSDFGPNAPFPFARVGFEAEPGEYEFNSDSGGGGADTRILVLDSSCDCVAWGDGNPGGNRASTVTFEVSNGGPMHLLITSMNQVTGAYTLEIRDVN